MSSANTQQTQVKIVKKPFKLCFVNKREIGRSYVRVERPLKTVIPIMGKFYTKKTEVTNKDLGDIIKTLNILDIQDKYDYPLTGNQSYGWYKLDRASAVHPLLDYKKHTQQMIKENLMNFAKIRE